MAVIGILAVAQVRDDQHVCELVFDSARRALNGAVGIVVAARNRILRFGDSEEQNAVNSQGVEHRDFLYRRFHGVSVDAGHRRDGAGRCRVFHHEHGLHELRDAHLVLAHELANGLRPAQPARANELLQRGAHHAGFPPPHSAAAPRSSKLCASVMPTVSACAVLSAAARRHSRTAARPSGAHTMPSAISEPPS